MSDDTITPFVSSRPRGALEVKTGDPIEASYANGKGFYITFNSVYVGGRVDFKAFINSFHDNFTADWASDSPYGRIDSVKTHSQTSRMMDISFSVPAFSVYEAKENLAKVSALIKMLYPSYENRGSKRGTTFASRGSTGADENEGMTTGTANRSVSDRYCISAPPLLTVKFANLIKTIRPATVILPGEPELGDTFLEGEMTGVIGAVQNVSVSPRIDLGIFEFPEGQGDVMLYPKLIDISINFIVFLLYLEVFMIMLWKI